MLDTTIPSYLYQQYADDADCQAFVDQYNAATQNYVDWFYNTGVSLAYYPALTGDLLDWCAWGLYGMQRTSLETVPPSALGPLNTQPLNMVPLNSYTPFTGTYYSLTDDQFQRIITWNFFKGDGKRFCMRWLKRRIMRFLVGTNGLDPEPWNAGFVVGAENTSAISIAVTGSGVKTLTVTINQAQLSSVVAVAPGILTIFQLAFLNGVLDLPVQYQYACVID
jgi:hypothetical protein